jgi:hypothetical protein
MDRGPHPNLRRPRPRGFGDYCVMHCVMPLGSSYGLSCVLVAFEIRVKGSARLLIKGSADEHQSAGTLLRFAFQVVTFTEYKYGVELGEQI